MVLALALVFGLPLLAGIVLMSIYNRLVTLRNHFQNAFAQIDVQLKRRYELVPNLVETAKAYLEHESETLERVIAARNAAVSARQKAAHQPGELGSMKALSGADAQLTQHLGRLMVVAEDYPELKADQTMKAMMEELTSTENKVAFARQAYNDAVTGYNIHRERFPNIFIANSFNFIPAQVFEVDSDATRQAPQISFD